MEFKNHYNQIGRKKNFAIKYTANDATDQSQISSASITEMAKRYGIDAIIAKAEKLRIEEDSLLAGKLYGNDYTNMFTSRDELLNVKKKLNNVFENIPARLRKELFNDNPMEFINAYTTQDEKKLEKLVNVGLVSQSQIEQVKTFNANRIAKEQEEIKRKQFITALEQQQGALYENFKETGTINISIPKDNTVNTGNISPSVS